MEGFKNFWRHKLTAVTAVVSIFLSLLSIGFLIILYQNSSTLVDYLRSKYKIEVFYDIMLTNEQAIALTEQIRKIEGIQSATLINKEDALQIFKDQFDEDLYEMLGYNPLPYSCVVNVVKGDMRPFPLEPIIKNIQKSAGVDEVVYQGRLIEKIENFFQQILKVLAIAAVIILFITVIIISNTIKLSVYAKRDLIRTLKLIGATNTFVKLPFMIEGIIQSLIGSMLAITVLYGGIRVGNLYLGRFTTIVIDPAFLYLLGLVLVGIIITSAGGYRATRRYIRREKLY
jgi:cell division transport system permease protein